MVRVPNTVLLLISGGRLPGPHLFACSALIPVESVCGELEVGASEKPVSSLRLDTSEMAGVGGLLSEQRAP